MPLLIRALAPKFPLFRERNVVIFITPSWWGGRPRWLSWMRRPTGDQEVAGSTPAEVGNILSWRLIMKYFLRSFFPFCWFKKGSCQFLAKECAHYWLTACPVNVWLGKLTALDMTPLGWLGRKTSTQTNTLSLPLIQEGQLSVSGKRMCTILVNRLED